MRKLLPVGPIARLIAANADHIYSYEELEDRTGVQRETLRGLTRGKQARLSIDLADRIATALGRALAELYPDDY